MALGYWCPVLHAHLPYVRHLDDDAAVEEAWLFEALTESYVPLLLTLDRLVEDGVDFRLTLSLSPTLLSMLDDPLLVGRYGRHLDGLIELAGAEVERARCQDPRLEGLARFYVGELRRVRAAYSERYRSGILAAFCRLRDLGRLELIGCAATHGLLPLLESVPEAGRAQVLVGVAEHRRLLGQAPVGFWLPECGYSAAVEPWLAEAGVRYVFLDAHGLTDAHPRPSHGVLAPIVTPAGTVCFGRHLPTSRMVWSAQDGYPGDPVYREFHRDVGLELPGPVLERALGAGTRRHVGIKYHRVTGATRDLGQKELYEPERARARAADHAQHFHATLREMLREAAPTQTRPPVVVSAYDAELFGHWWYEGPHFLDRLFRCLGGDASVELVTPSELLSRHPRCEVAQPPFCTWGEGGYAAVWLSPENDWLPPLLDRAALEMVGLARHFANPDQLQRRALQQAGRELLLAQASDWAFIMKTGTTVEYARRRLREHLERFGSLRDALSNGQLQPADLTELWERDPIFPDLDPRVFV